MFRRSFAYKRARWQDRALYYLQFCCSFRRAKFLLTPSLQWTYTITSALHTALQLQAMPTKASVRTHSWIQLRWNQQSSHTNSESNPKSKATWQGEEEKWHEPGWGKPCVIIIKNYLQGECPHWDNSKFTDDWNKLYILLVQKKSFMRWLQSNFKWVPKG